ncbi:siderophore-interacting protein [Salinibacterium sp. ZJ77]|uniref:siderophore-interacting protein n=1 Tax=Salinibacterium sp. ZJ77 TaxID=2708337 RepID=UPI00141D8B82|nr:siderophore-interacting protein [Salinibacterium sp. ZJ77]
MSADPAFRIMRARVERVERVSPTFVRITFGGPELARFGTPGHVFDQRVKLVFPAPGRALPEFDAGDPDWYRAWLARPDDERGSMRTYSIRELIVDGDETRAVIDFVLHLAPGASGPASRWASTAQLGDELILVGPQRGRFDGGGIEFSPGEARTLVLAGDETAAPAIARILEDADPASCGVAFIEVPDAADALPIAAPPGVHVRWLPRGGTAHGTRLIPSMLEHLGAIGDAHAAAPVQLEDVDSEDLVWETPVYSGLGEELPKPVAHPDRYYWVAGESAVVTTLRRHLVKELGIDRAQVAFMGYWRRGVAMRG